MVYILDDDWDSDLRVIQAGTAALGLYTRCGMYVARKTLDGFVPSEIAAAYGTPEWARKLVDAGLWEIREGGYFMPDFLARNPTAERAQRRKEQKAERQRRWLDNQGKKRRKKGASRDASHGVSIDAPEDVHHLLPSPTEKEMVARPRYAHGAARDHPTEPVEEDPHVVAEEEERLRLETEAAVTAIAEHQRRTQRGASAARAVIGGRRKPPPRRDAIAELRALTEIPEETTP